MKDLHTLDKYRITDERTRDHFGWTGDAGCGAFKVYVGGRSFFAVASAYGGWDHVSVSPANRNRQVCPTWEEMCVIKNMFFEPEDCVVQFHPPKSEYVNNHPYCLHMWRCHDGREMPMPPKFYV